MHRENKGETQDKQGKNTGLEWDKHKTDKGQGQTRDKQM